MRDPLRTAGPGSAAPAEAPRARRFPPWLAAALLSALVFATFSAALAFPFAGLDDGDYVAANPHVHQGFTRANLVWALTQSHFSNWHPLTWASHMLDWKLWGPAASGHHLTSLLLHAANAALLFAFFLRATGLLWPSLLSAALFALHPLRVESVVWISERKDVLCAFFFFALLHAWLGYVRRPGPGRYALVLLLLAAGLASKPMLVTAPLVLLLVDVWPLGRLAPGAPLRRWLWLGAEKLPLLALSLGSALVTLRAQSAGRAMSSLHDVPPGDRLANAATGVATYLAKTVWPTGLAVHYPLAGQDLASRWPQVLAACALVAALTALAASRFRAQPAWAAGWAWMLVMLLPVIGLVQVGSQAVADRYTYLPLVGPVAAVCFSLPWDLGSRRGALLRAGAAALVAACVLLSARQTEVWRDSRSLFERVLAITPGDSFGEQGLANLALAEGRFEEADARFDRVLAASPQAGRALLAKGMLALQRNQPARALEWCLRAQAVEPDQTLVAPTLSQALVRLGRAQEAVALLQPLAEANPGYPALASAYGLALGVAGRPREAMRQLQRAVALTPSDASLRLNLGVALAQQGLLQEAIEAFEAALTLEPGLSAARARLEQAREDLARRPAGSR